MVEKYDCIVLCPNCFCCSEPPNSAIDFFLLLPLETLVDVLLLFVSGLHDVPSSSSFSFRLVVEPLPLSVHVTLSGVTSVEPSLAESISITSVVVVTAAAVSGVIRFPVAMISMPLLVWHGSDNGSILCFEFCPWRCFFNKINM